MSRAISLEDVRLAYGGKTLLADFRLLVAQGEVLALLGPSGSGKTTILRLILGLTAPDRGVIRLGDAVVTEGRRLRVPVEERGLSVVFQDLGLWPHLTVGGNLSFGLAARGVDRRERRERVAAMLERLGLADHADKHPGALSGGERQRVAIARALVLQPRAVLLDEPLSNLDVALRRDLLALFRELFRERQSTAVYVTHDLREAVALGDRIAVLESGRISQVGSLDELRAAPATGFVDRVLQDLDWKPLPSARGRPPLQS